MKMAIFLLMIAIVFVSIGCQKRTTIVKQPHVLPSEYYINGTSEDVLKRINDKYSECYSNRDEIYQRTVKRYINYINIIDSKAGVRSIYAEPTSPTQVRVYASLPFDSTPRSMYEAEVFRMGAHGSPGCPK